MEEIFNQKIKIRNLIEFGTGMSSNAILEKYLGENKDFYYDYPHDYSDLMRCVNVISIFDININIMKETNPIWSDIVDNWKSLIHMIELKNKDRVNEILDSIKLKHR